MSITYKKRTSKRLEAIIAVRKYEISVLTAGLCWGFMGFFTRKLSAFGIDSSGAIVLRCGIAALCFLAVLLIRNPRKLQIRKNDVWCFVGAGCFSLLFFTYCYFTAISMMSLSVAAILLYTAPTIVMLLSAILFHEQLTRVKLGIAALAFAGCVLVSGIGGKMMITPLGLLVGLGAGFGYALYTIFSRFALQRGYSSVTINFYACLLAAAGALVLHGSMDIFRITFSSPGIFGWCVATGVFTCFVPYLLYTYGLNGLENGKASVLASIEPVVATLLGVFFYHETLTVQVFLGVVLVLTAVVLLSRKQASAKA